MTQLAFMPSVATVRAFVAISVNRALFGLVVTRGDSELDFSANIVAIAWSPLLLLR